MANKTMKTLTMNNVTYEIVDEYARNNVDEIEKALAEKQPVGDYALKSEIPATTDVVEENNTNPVSSFAVYTALSNVKTIPFEEIDEICNATIQYASRMEVKF